MSGHGQIEKIAVLQEQVTQLRAALREDFTPPVQWRLTCSEQIVLSTLLKRDVASRDVLMAALYGDRLGDVPCDKIVEVFVSTLRKKLLRFGIRVETARERGWALSADMKRRVRGAQS